MYPEFNALVNYIKDCKHVVGAPKSVLKIILVSYK